MTNSAARLAKQKPARVVFPKEKFVRGEICDLPIDGPTGEQACEWMIEYLRSDDRNRPAAVMSLNAHVVTDSIKNRKLREAIQSASLITADGISIVWAARLLGFHLPERVPGGELMERFCEASRHHNFSVFFLGGLQGAATNASAKLRARFPNLRIAGHYCPPFGFEQDVTHLRHIRDLLAATAPDVLFVALGVPKQETWILDQLPYLSVRIAMPVGAALDTIAGFRKRAPEWARKSGTEWFYRLAMEPRRLWRRYLIGNLHFSYLIFRQWLQNRINPR